MTRWFGSSSIPTGTRPSKPWGSRSKTLTPTPEPAGYCAGDVAGERGDFIQPNPRTPKERHEMKAITLNKLGTAPTVRVDVPTPTPGPREVLVRVQASSVNPVDNSIAAGTLDGMVEHEFPVILGRDYAGVVDQVGAEVTDYA